MKLCLCFYVYKKVVLNPKHCTIDVKKTTVVLCLFVFCFESKARVSPIQTDERQETGHSMDRADPLLLG